MSAQNLARACGLLRYSGADAKATMDITPWMDWFFGCLGHAIEGGQTTLGSVLSKVHCWDLWGLSVE